MVSYTLYTGTLVHYTVLTSYLSAVWLIFLSLPLSLALSLMYVKYILTHNIFPLAQMNVHSHKLNAHG